MNDHREAYIVTYDVSQDKLRNKVEKIIKEYGVRVQYSCFYCPIEKRILLQILMRLEKIIDKKTDSVIAVPLEKDWEKYVIGTLRNDPNFEIKRVI